jgi:hypothetical protein
VSDVTSSTEHGIDVSDLGPYLRHPDHQPAPGDLRDYARQLFRATAATDGRDVVAAVLDDQAQRLRQLAAERERSDLLTPVEPGLFVTRRLVIGSDHPVDVRLCAQPAASDNPGSLGYAISAWTQLVNQLPGERGGGLSAHGTDVAVVGLDTPAEVCVGVVSNGRPLAVVDTVSGGYVWAHAPDLDSDTLQAVVSAAMAAVDVASIDY